MEQAGPREKIYFVGPTEVRHRHLWGASPGVERCHPRGGAEPLPQLYGANRFWISLRVPGADLPLRPHPRGVGPGRREPHPRIRRDDPGFIAREPGYLRNGRHDGPHEPGHAVCGGRRRHAARRSGHRRGDPAPGAQDQCDRHPQDASTTTSPTWSGPLASRRPCPRRSSRSTRPTPRPRAPATGSACEAHGPGVRLHRRVRLHSPAATSTSA